MNGYWTPNPKALARERARYMREHYSGGQGQAHSHLLDPTADIKLASWIGTELMPRLDELREQGYDLNDQAMIVEMLAQMGEYQAAEYIQERQAAEWQMFVDDQGTELVETAGTHSMLEKILQAAKAAGLGVADTWESDAENQVEARIEFYAQKSDIHDFAQALGQRMPELRFEVDETNYEYPTLWIRGRQEQQADNATEVAKQAKELIRSGQQSEANELLNKWARVDDYASQSYSWRMGRLYNLGLGVQGSDWVIHGED